MRNKLKGALVATLLAATATAPALAQAAGGVLTLDIERLYSDSAAAKSAQSQLLSRYQGPSQQAQTAFQAASTAYNAQVEAARKLVGPSGDASKLPPATRQSLGQAQERVENARNQGLALQQQVEDSRNYVREQIVQAVLPIAEQVRAERKAAAVMPAGSLLAADPAADITSVVLPRLDAKLASVQIQRPQGAAPTAVPGAGTAVRPAAPATGARPQPQGR